MFMCSLLDTITASSLYTTAHTSHSVCFFHPISLQNRKFFLILHLITGNKASVEAAGENILVKNNNDISSYLEDIET